MRKSVRRGVYRPTIEMRHRRLCRNEDDRLMNRIVLGAVEPMQALVHLRGGNKRAESEGKRLQIVRKRDMRIEYRIFHQLRRGVKLVDCKFPILPADLSAIWRDQPI